MSETVIRHRGGGRDEDGAVLPSSATPLPAKAVEPQAGSRVTRRAGNGLRVQCVVYFVGPVDLTDDDELTVRGQRYQIDVGVWRSPWTSRQGVEVLCTRGEG